MDIQGQISLSSDNESCLIYFVLKIDFFFRKKMQNNGAKETVTNWRPFLKQF